jgi:hypothetical protein
MSIEVKLMKADELGISKTLMCGMGKAGGGKCSFMANLSCKHANCVRYDVPMMIAELMLQEPLTVHPAFQLTLPFHVTSGDPEQHRQRHRVPRITCFTATSCHRDCDNLHTSRMIISWIVFSYL